VPAARVARDRDGFIQNHIQNAAYDISAQLKAASDRGGSQSFSAGGSRCDAGIPRRPQMERAQANVCVKCAQGRSASAVGERLADWSERLGTGRT